MGGSDFSSDLDMGRRPELKSDEKSDTSMLVHQITSHLSLKPLKQVVQSLAARPLIVFGVVWYGGIPKWYGKCSFDCLRATISTGALRRGRALSTAKAPPLITRPRPSPPYLSLVSVAAGIQSENAATEEAHQAVGDGAHRCIQGPAADPRQVVSSPKFDSNGAQTCGRQCCCRWLLRPVGA